MYCLAHFKKDLLSIQYHRLLTNRSLQSAQEELRRYLGLRGNRRKQDHKDHAADSAWCRCRVGRFGRFRRHVQLSAIRHNSIDKLICADINLICFEYEVGNVEPICWIPGAVNLAYPGTERDSPLCEALPLRQFSGKVPIDLSRHESRRFDRSLR